VLYKFFFQKTSLNEPSVEAHEVATRSIQKQLYIISWLLTLLQVKVIKNIALKLRTGNFIGRKSIRVFMRKKILYYGY